MRKLRLIILLSYLITGCKKPVDMNDVFFKNKAAFKKIESPIKTHKRYVFEKTTLILNHPTIDSAYLASIEEIFFITECDIAYILNGDVLIGYKRSFSKLFFTNKNTGDSIELLNFNGTLNYLLQNGKLNKRPFAIQIAPKWYIVNDIDSL